MAPLQPGAAHAGAHDYDALAVLGGLGGVRQQVEEHLVHLRGRAGDARQLAELAPQRAVLQLVLRDADRALDALVQVEIRDLAAVEPAEVLEVADHLRDLADAENAVLHQALDLGERGAAAQRGETFAHLRELRRQLRLVGALGRQQPEQPPDEPSDRFITLTRLAPMLVTPLTLPPASHAARTVSASVTTSQSRRPRRPDFRVRMAASDKCYPYCGASTPPEPTPTQRPPESSTQGGTVKRCGEVYGPT